MSASRPASSAPPVRASGAAIYEPFSHEAEARPTQVVIAPSLLSSDFAHTARELARCKQARAHWIHVDIMDGHFVPNLTLGPPILARWHAAAPELFYDAHLMIERPLEFAEPFVKAGANLLTLHIETLTPGRARRELRNIKRLGAHVGVTLRPRTPLKAVLDVLDEVDLVLVMSVEPGFGGQELIPKMLNRVRELDLLRRQEKLPFRLEIDGGINLVTAPLAVAAGADVLVAGHALFGGGDVVAGIKAMRAAITGKNAMEIKRK